MLPSAEWEARTGASEASHLGRKEADLSTSIEHFLPAREIGGKEGETQKVRLDRGKRSGLMPFRMDMEPTDGEEVDLFFMSRASWRAADHIDLIHKWMVRFQLAITRLQ